MALIVDEQSNFKHFCRICKKGFGCGRALGGHMRAHGIGGDESSGAGGHLDDEDPVSDWEEKLIGAGNVPPTNKRMYALRTNPNRFKSCRVCENCGKEFLSWKSFLEHGKCSSDDVESLVSDADDGRRGCSGHGWSKRKRSLRAKVGNFNSNWPSNEEEDLANVLMMLSNAAVDPLATAEPEESCASASKDLEERRNQKNFLNPISYKLAIDHKAKGVAGKGMFECKACKKVFNSHQALGGHRASHKKVKGCFAARLDHLEDQDNLAHEDFITQEEFFPTKPTSTLQFDHHFPIASTSNRKSKVHECSICHRIFSSGQALGGHKRCHWITSNSPDTASMKFHQFRDHQIEQIQQRPKYNIIDSDALDLNLDLNLPAAGDHDLAGAGWDRANPSSFEVSTEIQLQYDHHHHGSYHERKQNDNDNNITNGGGSKQNVEDEADSKVKLAKLSELKDMSMTEGSSSWLQVGIGSTTDVEADP